MQTKEHLMSHIHVLICRVDDPTSDQLTELAAFDLPEADLTTLQPQTARDDLEITTHTAGTTRRETSGGTGLLAIYKKLHSSPPGRSPPAKIEKTPHAPQALPSCDPSFSLNRR